MTLDFARVVEAHAKLEELNARHAAGLVSDDDYEARWYQLAGDAMRADDEYHAAMIAADITEAEFERAYEYLAARGTSDSPGGAEYRRVRGEWLEAGRPEPLPFITVRANSLPKPAS